MFIRTEFPPGYVSRSSELAVFCHFVFLLSFICLFQVHSVAAADGVATTDEEIEILTRGPVHEAFADVAVDEGTPAVVTARTVPEPIKEIPPDYRPEGDNVQWISGYWSWDDDQNDFIWVSGIWREVPPGRQWIPGYWIEVEGGNQYISGYWADVEQKETIYLPPPPKPLQVTPTFPSPSADYVWIDGSWVWYGDGYAWQPGYWYAPPPDMLWVPAHYTWTPRGYIFVMGYWDYQVVRRGVMFAPCYYPRPVYRGPSFYYTPTIILNTDAVFLSLFTRRHHRHYYFGDYFDNRYEKRGFRPWYSERATIYGYDPFYRNYRRHHLQRDKHWEREYRGRYEYRREHIDERPAVYYTPRANRQDPHSHKPHNQMIGRPLAEVAAMMDQPIRYTQVKPAHKQEFRTRDIQLTTLQIERRKIETGSHPKVGPHFGNDRKKAERVEISASPITDISRPDFRQMRPDIQATAKAPQPHMHQPKEQNRRQPNLPPVRQQPAQQNKHFEQSLPRQQQSRVQQQELKQRPSEQSRERMQHLQQNNRYAQPSQQQPREQQQTHRQRLQVQPRERVDQVPLNIHSAQPAQQQPRVQQQTQQQRKQEEPKERTQPALQNRHQEKQTSQQPQVRQQNGQQARPTEQPRERKQPTLQQQQVRQPQEHKQRQQEQSRERTQEAPQKQPPQARQQKEQRQKPTDQPPGKPQSKRPKNGDQIPEEQLPSGGRR